MKCNKCGAELLDNDKFCGNCGSKITVASAVSGASEPFAAGNQKYQAPVIYNDNTDSSDYAENDKLTADKKSKSPIIVFVLIVFILLLLLFTLFNYLLMTNRIDTDKFDVLEGYKDSLSEFLNIDNPSDDFNDIEMDETVTEESTTKSTTEESTTEGTTTTTEETSESEDGIPSELQKYEDGLEYEGKTYRIALQEDDWYINYRSSPKFIDVDKKSNNILGKLKHGTEIYVEYIYDETWAVFYKDGKYVFSSLYASNDPSMSSLMEIV